MNLAINQSLKLFSLSVFCTAMTCGSAYAKEFDLFADEATRPADYREKLVEIHDLSQKAIVYLGMPTLALMGDLDSAIDFGRSDDWAQGRNTSVNKTVTCWGTGGYDATLTRSDFRKYSGTVTASNCGSFGFVINGTASFEYDDAVWKAEVRPRIDFALVWSFTNLEVRGGDGNLYTYNGKMQCDKSYNAATSNYIVDYLSDGEFTYRRGTFKYGALNRQFSRDDLLRGVRTGNVLSSTLVPHNNCDFSNVSVTVNGLTHNINGIKFVSEYRSGPDPTTSYVEGFQITSGRNDRLDSINSGLTSRIKSYELVKFSHATYGDYTFGYLGDSISRVGLIEGDSNSDLPQTPGTVRSITAVIQQTSVETFTYWSWASNDIKYIFANNRSRPNINSATSSIRNSSKRMMRLNCGITCQSLNQSRTSQKVTSNASALWDHEVQFAFLDLDQNGLADWQVLFSQTGVPKFTNRFNNLTDYFELDPSTDAVRFYDYDSDGSVDEVDLDDDNDDVEDTSDAFPLDASESVDTDSDGIGNNADKDDDGDGVSDKKEGGNGTDPLKADTDGDGSNDNLDAFPLDASEQLDGDGDGIGDNGDNCASIANTSQTNTDNDGLGNACDDDDDNDGVLDTRDAFPLDASETIDADSDGTGNNSDNCRGLVNANQSNVDGDKNGDACDSDDDNDGVADIDDAFPKDATETVDTDGDGIGDNFDAAPLDPTVQKIGSRVPMWMLNMIKNQQTGQTEQTSD